MISAVSEATVPKISVIVRKAYGAGLYAMSGPAFDPDCTIALPTAKIAVMGPSAAVNAVFYNQLQAIEDEDERGGQARRADGGVRRGRRPAQARLGDGDRRDRAAARTCAPSWSRRFGRYAGKVREWPAKRNAIPPA